MNKELAFKLLEPYLPPLGWEGWELGGIDAKNDVVLGVQPDWSAPVCVRNKPSQELLDAMYWYLAYTRGPTFFDTANERTSRF